MNAENSINNLFWCIYFGELEFVQKPENTCFSFKLIK